MITSIEDLDLFFNSYNPSMGNGKLRENRLQRMELLLSAMGNPESSFKAIHIAGSKGKGTTASYLSKIISLTGRKCGLYMSPHVYDIRERFTDSLSFFDEKLYIDSANQLLSFVDDFYLDEEYGLEKPTTFELYTAYAYLLFKNAGCEYAVIETGLGGRLDATNTLSPIAAVITSIELEHTNVLGSTKEEIAREKAGIIKKERPVFTGGDLSGTIEIIKEIASEKKSEVIQFYPTDLENIKLDDVSTIKRYDALLAYAIADKLNIAPSGTIDLSEVAIPARYEKNQIKFQDKNICIVFDGAHTEASASITMDTILKDLSLAKGISMSDEAVLIFSAADGKNISAIGSILFPYFKNIIITSCGSFKKSYPDKIYSEALDIVPSHDLVLRENTKEATEEALKIIKNEGHIFVIGSFYLCSEIKNALKELGI